MKKTIFANDFYSYYPHGIMPCPMYVDVANKIYNQIRPLELEIPNADAIKKDIAINVAIFYEDKMSDTGIWNSFANRHYQMYQEELPFHDGMEIFEDDIIPQEIELLIWMVLSRTYTDQLINPMMCGSITTDIIMDILDEADEVEVNKSLYNFIYNKENAQDYFKQKQVLFWLRNCYLHTSPLTDKLYDQLLESYPKSFNKRESNYYAETEICMFFETGPLALLAHQYLADMYDGHGWKKEAQKLRNLEYHMLDYFTVTKNPDNTTTLTDVNGNEFIMLPNDSVQFCDSPYVMTSLVRYDGRCEINGFVVPASMEDYHQHQELMSRKNAEKSKNYQALMKCLNGRHLFFFANKAEAHTWLKSLTPTGTSVELPNIASDIPLVAYISQESGIIFTPKIVHAIKSDDNPFYGKCDAPTRIMETIATVIVNNIVSPELLHHLLENNMLQDGDVSSIYMDETGNKIFTKNIDFIARFFRRHNYYSHKDC